MFKFNKFKKYSFNDQLMHLWIINNEYVNEQRHVDEQNEKDANLIIPIYF
jgi:hypothetical protein